MYPINQCLEGISTCISYGRGQIGGLIGDFKMEILGNAKAFLLKI